MNVPNVAQDGYSLEDDERRMMKRADEFSDEFDASGHIYTDLALEQYLNDLAVSLMTEGQRASGINIRVKVIADPSLNAAAFPNGHIYIHSGMLAAMENEAQLATILGHEMTHVFNRHALKEFRSLINKTAFMSATSMITAVAVGNGGAALIQLGVASSIYGYSQAMEFEADEEGYRTVTERGYDAQETVKIFEQLKINIEEEDVKQPFFFSTHPNVVARIRKYEKMFAVEPSENTGGKTNPDVFQTKVKDLMVANLQLCLQSGMFRTAQRNIDAYVARYPSEAIGFYWKGELYRQRQDRGKREKKRDKTPDYDEALAAYDQAIGLDAGLAAAYRGKGQILEKKGMSEEAKTSFRKYLEMEPQAEDKEYIELFLAS